MNFVQENVAFEVYYEYHFLQEFLPGVLLWTEVLPLLSSPPGSERWGLHLPPIPEILCLLATRTPKNANDNFNTNFYILSLRPVVRACEVVEGGRHLHRRQWCLCLCHVLGCQPRLCHKPISRGLGLKENMAAKFQLIC